MTRTNAWGREVRDVQRNAFGREVVTDPPKTNAWGRPEAQPKRNAWGRPVGEAVRRSPWGREIVSGQSTTTSTEQEPTAPNPHPIVECPQATKTTVVREAAGDPNDPLRPWPTERLLDLKPGTRIAIVRQGADGRWEPARGYATA